VCTGVCVCVGGGGLRYAVEGEGSGVAEGN
jgi:hypothetical protein